MLNTLKALARRGWRTTLLPVDTTGIVHPDALADALTDETAIVSVMHANNEIGTIQPIAELARLAHARGALFHTDAVQSVGKIPVDVRRARRRSAVALGAQVQRPERGRRAVDQARHARDGDPDRRQARAEPARRHRERARRSPGSASRRASRRRSSPPKRARLAALRDRLEEAILAAVPGTTVNGAREPRVPNTTNISFDGVEAESLLIALDLEGFAVSTGSACSSGTLEPSHVLRAMGLPVAPHAELDPLQPRRRQHRRGGGLRRLEAAGGRGEAAQPHARAARR